MAAVPWLLRFGQDLGKIWAHRPCGGCVVHSEPAPSAAWAQRACLWSIHARAGCARCFRAVLLALWGAACLQCPTAELSRVCRNVHDCADASQFALMSPREA